MGATAREEQLLRRLRARPEMMAAREELVAAVHTECAATSIDAVEEAVVARTRELGRVTLQTWAQQAEEQTAHEQRAQRPRRRVRTKKNSAG
jgi:hypothetical protein